MQSHRRKIKNNYMRTKNDTQLDQSSDITIQTGIC